MERSSIKKIFSFHPIKLFLSSSSFVECEEEMSEKLRELIGEKIIDKNQKLVDVQKIFDDNQLIGIYFSAKWSEKLIVRVFILFCKGVNHVVNSLQY